MLTYKATPSPEITDPGYSTIVMLEPATALWGLRISGSDFKKLKTGFKPQDQDDKWRVSVTDHQSQNSDIDVSSGNIAIHVSRSWSGKYYYILVLKPSDSGNGSVEALTWEQNKNGVHISEEMAKKEVVAITRIVLECDFDALPEDYSDGAFNYPLHAK